MRKGKASTRWKRATLESCSYCRPKGSTTPLDLMLPKAVPYGAFLFTPLLELNAITYASRPSGASARNTESPSLPRPISEPNEDLDKDKEPVPSLCEEIITLTEKS